MRNFGGTEWEEGRGRNPEGRRVCACLAGGSCFLFLLEKLRGRGAGAAAADDKPRVSPPTSRVPLPLPALAPPFSFPVYSPPSCFSACFYLFNNSSCSCFCLLSPVVFLFVLQVFPLISDRGFFSIFFGSVRSFFISVHRPRDLFPSTCSI